jgi:hypothetical protein
LFFQWFELVPHWFVVFASTITTSGSGSLSVQTSKRLRGGELILKGYDNDLVSI